MKQLLANSLFSLITGASFVLGAFGIATLLEINDDATKPYEHINQPSDFEILEHALVEKEPRFTVQGSFANNGNLDWINVGIVMRIYAGDAFMTHCSQNIRHVKSQSNRNFRITCDETAGSNLPDNISYRLEVGSGSR